MFLSLAKLDEFDEFYKIKIEKNNIFWTGWANEPDYLKLKNFYDNCIYNLKTIKDRRIYLAHDKDAVVGYVYIDYVNNDTFAVSPAISSNFQGKGLGKKLIELVIKEGLKLGYKNMEAFIREDNIASQKIFEFNGVHKTEIYKDVYIENQNRNIKMYKYYYSTKKTQ